MGKDVFSIRTTQPWFRRCENSNLELEDLPHTGRSLQVDMDLIKHLIEEGSRLTTRCLAVQLRCTHTVVEKHLIQLDKVWRYGVWILHDLSPDQLQYRIDACMDLITSNRKHEWPHNLVTDDEQ